MEFNSEAVTAAGFGVDAVAFERLEHATRTKVIVEIWPSDLYRLFGEDIALCQLFFQSDDHFTSVCSSNNHVSLFL